MLNSIESRFLEVTQLSMDITPFPLVDQTRFTIRKELSKSHGEVFTPLWLVDKMILKANPYPDKFNMDLCVGRGQFTIRMLRKFSLDNSNFDIKYYLSNWHWFNEINEQSCKELLKIFGHNINLAFEVLMHKYE